MRHHPWLSCAALLVSACGDGRETSGQTPRVAPADGRGGIAVRRVATGLTQPLHLAAIPGDRRVFVAEKGGIVVRLDPATGARETYLSVRERVDARGRRPDFSEDGERGLLGIAAAPDYPVGGELFVFVTGQDGSLQVRRYGRGRDGLGDPLIRQTIVSVDHSRANDHNGGWLGFGPDGMLYVATGDGGGRGDPQGNAQNPNVLLGKILRFRRDPATGNWVAAGNADPEGRGAPAVFALGLRNPFRAGFSGNALLIGDVGETAREEIDLLPLATPGVNFGWPFREGSRPFRGTAPAGLTDPVTEYARGEGPRQGKSVTGGLVYRGPAAALRGRYIFGDFVAKHVWSVPADELRQGRLLPAARYELHDLTPDAGTIDLPASFGEDAAGNLYLVDLDGEIFLIGAG